MAWTWHQAEIILKEVLGVVICLLQRSHLFPFFFQILTVDVACFLPVGERLNFSSSLNWVYWTNILRGIQRWWNAFVVVSELLAHPILTPVWKVFTSQSCIQSPKEIWWSAFLHSQETQSFNYLPSPEELYSFLLILMIKEENTRKIFSDTSVEMTKSLINYRTIRFDLVWVHSLVVRVRQLASHGTFYSLVILWGTFTYVIQLSLLSIIISPPVSDEMN